MKKTIITLFLSNVLGFGLLHARDSLATIATLSPVNFHQFSAETSLSSVELTWISDFSDLTANYEIQRSVDGKDWQPLGLIACQRTPDGPMLNEFYDPQPYAGLNRYRIIRTSATGVQSVSSELQVVHMPAFDVHVYPNPINLGEELQIQVSGAAEQEFQVELIDMHGRRFTRRSFTSETALTKMTLPANTGARGVYFVQVFIQDVPLQAFPIKVK